MSTLATAMVLTPAARESIGGTPIVFAVAGSVTATVPAVESWWRRRHPASRQQRAKARA